MLSAHQMNEWSTVITVKSLGSFFWIFSVMAALSSLSLIFKSLASSTLYMLPTLMFASDLPGCKMVSGSF